MNQKLVPFLLLSLIHLGALLFERFDIAFYTKPLLITSLLLYFLLETKEIKNSIKPVFIIALIASISGDIFLLFDEQNSIYFLLGLGSFLITQILYCYIFSKIKKGSIFKISNPSGSIIPILFFIFILTAIWGNLEYFMKIPVTLYAISIFMMVFLSGNLKSSISKNAWLMIWIGAMFFMFSDTTIGLNKFNPTLNPFSNSRFLTMLTYLLAQLGIVVGVVTFLKQRDKI